MTSFYECRSSPRVTDGSRSQVQGQRALSTWASPLRHNLTPPPCVVTASCVIRTPMFRLRDERHTDTYQNMLLTELIDQFCGCGDITGWILQRRNKNGQTLEFNNNNTDCWNILTNNTNNNTTSSFVIRVIVTNLTPIKDQWLTQTGWTFNRTTSLSLHTFCHYMMEMDVCILVILWTRLMHPASNHLLPVDTMCEILTKVFLSVLEKTLVSVRDDEATTKSSLYRETTRHNTNNNFIFTLRPKHRTEPAINRVEDDAEPAVGDDGEYSGRRCQKEPESLQEDVEVGWWFIHTTTTVPLFWKCDQINPDV